jgi:hypothetical protein
VDETVLSGSYAAQLDNGKSFQTPTLPRLPDGPVEQNCRKAEPKDILIAELVHQSWRVRYPLTRLHADEDGNITGPALPGEIAGSLDVINSVPEARESVVRALRKVSGLPDYGMLEIGYDSAACEQIPAWTPAGTTLVDTASYWVNPDGTNEQSWKTAHREFGKECPLIKTAGNRDIIDPPGDGSTNDPPSQTVSATGVRADVWGICPRFSWPGIYCKLSYATGINYTGRACSYYNGSLRCLLK